MTILKKAIRCSIKEFVLNDWRELININTHEITFSHRIAVYLEDKFKKYGIDLEYNRDSESIKKLDNTGIRPDIIIHRRNTSDNLCVFEIKKNSIDSPEAHNDIEKLKSEIKKYHYRLGVL